MDNWKHRSKGMLCGSCMYFVLKNSEIGRCRRNAPTMGGWPAVYCSDWCGNHKIDEEKIVENKKNLNEGVKNAS